MSTSLDHLLLREAAKHPGRVALATPRQSITYGELLERSGVLRDALLTTSVRERALVAVCMEPGVAMCVATNALLLAGIPFVLVSHDSPPDEVRRTIEAAGVSAAITSHGRVHGSAASELVAHAPCLILNTRAEPTNLSQFKVATRSAECGSIGDDVAIILATSGTTGIPKLVAHSYASIVREQVALLRLQKEFFADRPLQLPRRVTTVVRRFGYRLAGAVGSQVWANSLRWESVGGFTLLLAGIVGGHTTLAWERLAPRAFLDLVGDHKANVWAMTPSFMRIVLRTRGIAERDFSSLLVVALGAERVPHDLAARVSETFRAAVCIGYGATELGGGVLVTRIYDSLDIQASTVGRPFPMVDVRIVPTDASTGTLQAGAQGRAGELWCRWQDDESWVATGDYASMDAGGNVTIHGRIDTMMSKGGRKFFPEEVEAVLLDHEHVSGAAVAQCRGCGETVALVIVDGASEPSHLDLREQCLSKLGEFKIPQRIVFAAELPSTRDGKIDRVELGKRVTRLSCPDHEVSEQTEQVVSQ
jgi:long-chain acyl-CoA synthetase